MTNGIPKLDTTYNYAGTYGGELDLDELMRSATILVLPPSVSGGDQDISMEDEVTPTTARLVTAPGKEPIFQGYIAD